MAEILLFLIKLSPKKDLSLKIRPKQDLSLKIT